MSWCRQPTLFLCAMLLVAGSVVLRAQTVTYTWTGLGYSYYSDSWWSNSSNWANGAVPEDNVDNTLIVFGKAHSLEPTYYEIYVNQLKFEGNTRPYYLWGDYDSTHIGSGGIIYNPAQPVSSVIDDDVQLAASQTWDIKSGTLTVYGSISDYEDGESSNYSIEKKGAGTLVLGSYSYDWDGGLILTAGQVVINPYGYSPYAALGYGLLTFNGGTLVSGSTYYNEGQPTYLYDNDVVSNGLISTINKAELHIGYVDDGSTTILLNADTTVQVQGQPLYLEGYLTDYHGESSSGFSLTLDSAGTLVLNGYSDYTGGTNVDKGMLIFGYPEAIPNYNELLAESLKAGSLGYIGIGFDPHDYYDWGETTGTVDSVFLDYFDRSATSGTIGFDTLPGSYVYNVFSDNIDLTGFAAGARLGSATAAILTGEITPQGDDYLFGGGGGLLVVSSQLTDGENPRAVVVESPEYAPLTLGLGSMTYNNGYYDADTHPGNSFTGGVSAKYSAVVFGPGAMPATGDFVLEDGGYIGNADSAISPADFISRFPITTNKGMIGFDYFGDSEKAEISDPIDLSSFTFPGVYLGTTTSAYLDGTITPQDNVYRFGAYKGGELEIGSNLTDGASARSVVIGDPDSPATFADFIERDYSTVILSGDNSYTGGTTLYGGRLVVGQSNDGLTTTALGTGTLTVEPFSFSADTLSLLAGETPAPSLQAADYNIVIPNDVVLNTTLKIDGNIYFTLAGTISGSGGLLLEDGATALSGDNSFSGGVTLSGYNWLDVYSDTALGTGLLSFELSYDYSSEVSFNTSAPVVHGLSSDNIFEDYSYLEMRADNTVLTIDQAVDTQFSGAIEDYSESGGLRVVKTGAGTLEFVYGGFYYYGGSPETSLPGTPVVGLQINQGALVIGTYAYIEDSSPTIWVHGGTLAVDNNYYPVNNPLVIDNGGRLAGHGYFDSATIGTGAILSPGLASLGEIGQLNFNHLELDPGGILEWQVNDVDPDNPEGHDQINVLGSTTLVVNATAMDQFTLKIISLTLADTAGILDGIDPDHGTYSWIVFTYDSLSTADPENLIASFNLDVSEFSTAYGIGTAAGSFFLTEGDGQLLLNFTPVPEPSTYALMALGLGATGLAAWRRRRRA